MHYTVSCCVLREHGDREWVSNGREGPNLIKAWIYRHEVPSWNLLGLSICTYFLKNEDQEGEINPFLGWMSVGGGGHKEGENEGVYSECILYPYMKIVE
jgi:hypothetical protein